MRTKLAVLLLCAIALTTVACHSKHEVQHHYITKPAVHLYEMEHAVAYHGNDGFWYWYFFMNSSTSQSYTAPFSSSAVSGTSWVRSTTAPAASGLKVVDEKEVSDQELDEEGAGAAPADTEVEEVAEPTEATPTAGTEPESAPSESSPTESSPSSDSSSSDSGGGDGGGSD